MANIKYKTDEERKAALAQYDALVAGGMTRGKAAKELGVSGSMPDYWRKKFSGGLKAPTIIEHDGSVERAPRKYKRPSQQPFIVFGSPADLAAFAKEMQ